MSTVTLSSTTTTSTAAAAATAAATPPPPSSAGYSSISLFNDKPEGASPPPTPSSQNISLPPTPTVSDDEAEDGEQEKEKDTERQQSILLPISGTKMAQEIIQKNIKLQRRGTVSLADLIPMASAALRAKQCLLDDSQQQQSSTLARALTKVKLGLQSHRLKEKYLMNEWKRLAFGLPVDESTINDTCNHYLISAYSKYSPLYNTTTTTTNHPPSSSHNNHRDSQIQNPTMDRTKEIVTWYEHLFKRTTLSVQEIEERVDRLRQQKLLLHQQQQQQQQQQQEEDETMISACSNGATIPMGNSNGTTSRHRGDHDQHSSHPLLLDTEFP
ncbi:hypothetical protein BDF20DRAFT_863317 [Mycotypha africana]|uniref:uncharacterized protein n=1 Tax=Mycotypha africana TaxID=64632 RepID=UPI00230013BF|nr:uncharacterized protein BDF20DRAFT_863317 [Mycotypha africana]KAI8981797.1 hypothetical protein BDF20DRAFT_863317 [Mycotypha africana]